MTLAARCRTRRSVVGLTNGSAGCGPGSSTCGSRSKKIVVSVAIAISHSREATPT